MQNSSLLGVVLAGGKSSRMGTDKAALKSVQGETFINLAVKRFENLNLAVVVGGNCAAPHAHPTVQDAVQNAGPIAAVVSCLEHAYKAGYEACLFVPIDTPHLDSTHLQSLIDRYGHFTQVTVANSDRIEPLIGIYPVSVLESIKNHLHHGRRSLFRWIETMEHQAVELPKAACHNVNSPEDLE